MGGGKRTSWRTHPPENLWTTPQLLLVWSISSGSYMETRQRVATPEGGCQNIPDYGPEGPERHLEVSRQRLTPHCFVAIFDSHLPSPKLSLEMPPKLVSHPKRGFMPLSQNNPRGDGETIERQRLSRGNL